MAYFDSKTGQLVLQIVYDGAAYSGKTASIESLGRLFRRPVVSPEVEEGRTLLFDWMEYEGGARFGRPIVCRVLTVPGQGELAHRRLRLIREADGVIFVADSRAEAFDATLRHWRDLRKTFDDWHLDAALTVQLNQRDAETALGAEAMRSALAEVGSAPWTEQFFETTAVRDEGTRAAFVLTVGATLRHHLAAGTLRDFDQDDSMADTQTVRTLSPSELAEVLAGGEPIPLDAEA